MTRWLPYALLGLYLAHLCLSVPEMAAYARGCVDVERCAVGGPK